MLQANSLIDTLTNRHLKAFWVRVVKTDSCWLWIGPLNHPNGYGTLVIRHQKYRAHRVSYFIHYHNLPTDKLVCHKCDNKVCVNPDHLFLGTYKDNAQDMSRKGRYKRYNPKQKFLVAQEQGPRLLPGPFQT